MAILLSTQVVDAPPQRGSPLLFRIANNSSTFRMFVYKINVERNTIFPSIIGKGLGAIKAALPSAVPANEL